MKLLIDDANVLKIKELYEYYPIDGVTTNPSILAKSGKKPYDVLKEIRSAIGDDQDLHVQVVSTEASKIIEEAKYIIEVLGENTYPKIPVNKEGIKAIKSLSEEGIKITATAIYTPMQAFLAAKSGASYVAPYVNRIDNLGYNGVETVKKIYDILVDYDTEILAASFKNSNQVLELLDYGIEASTCAPDVIEKLVDDRNVDAAIEAFINDFESLVGENKTMLDS